MTVNTLPMNNQHCRTVRTGMVRFVCFVAGIVFAFTVDGGILVAQQSASSDQKLKEVVEAAFRLAHNGYSSDEVILQGELNQAFVAACQKELPDVEAAVFNWTLLNLRKAGKLDVKTTKRNRRQVDSVIPIAEMCARMMEDRHRLSIDRLMTNPETCAEFDRAALAIDSEADTYLVRKAAFGLRKTRKLKPELITRIADWGRVVTVHKATELAKAIDRVPETPGIYMFRDATGYLYIGEAVNLRVRLTQHLEDSDRRSLADYLARQGVDEISIELHTFAPDSRISELTVRRAYESELIRSRNPRFNVRP